MNRLGWWGACALLCALVEAGCGGRAVGPPSGAESVDSGADVVVAPLCRDDRPLPGTPFVENAFGGNCTLPDGGLGNGLGAWGCVDPSVCLLTMRTGSPSHCKLGAGEAVCKAGRCIYASCSGITEDDACSLPDGSTGVCCAGVCRPADFIANDPSNCGGCGLGCASGMACANAYCGDGGSGVGPSCDGVVCAPGRVCAPTFCRWVTGGGTSCYSCVASSCASKPDGIECPGGMCCQQKCVDPASDNNNCGGCGIRCCPGTQCSPGSTISAAMCL
jgi:hypothetical protein